MIHELKTWPEPFQAIFQGRKTFDIRRNDRNFQYADMVNLREWEPQYRAYTGRELLRTVSHIEYGPNWELPPGVCVMALKKLEEIR